MMRMTEDQYNELISQYAELKTQTQDLADLLGSAEIETSPPWTLTSDKRFFEDGTSRLTIESDAVNWSISKHIQNERPFYINGYYDGSEASDGFHFGLTKVQAVDLISYLTEKLNYLNDIEQ